jgi:hypothetical protein
MNTKPLLKFEIFGHYLTVDDLTGYGSEFATVSLREIKNKPKAQPGSRVMLNPATSRTQLIELAFGLLDVADQMQPKATFATSDTVHSGAAEPTPLNSTFCKLAQDSPQPDIDRRRRDVSARFHRLRQRMPELQLAQRVLERCSDEVAMTLASLLFMADQTGDLPLRAGMQVAPSPEVMAAMPSSTADSEPGDKPTKH